MANIPRIIFFGGCTGINKSARLSEAVSGFNGKVEIIKISDLFLDEIKAANQNVKATIWKEYPWKEHEDEVLAKLISRIRGKHNLFIINNHFATISPYGYIPGLDMDNLEKLLNQCFPGAIRKNIEKSTKPVVGILHMDTRMNIIYKHYENILGELFDKTKIDHQNGDNAYVIALLPYISMSEIEKDLAENRVWAEAYSARASSVLPHFMVKTKAIYQDDGVQDLHTVKKVITEFVKQFIY